MESESDRPTVDEFAPSHLLYDLGRGASPAWDLPPVRGVAAARGRVGSSGRRTASVTAPTVTDRGESSPGGAPSGPRVEKEDATRILSAAALLTAEAFSVGLGVGLLSIGPGRAVQFLTANEVQPALRDALLALAVSLAAASLLSAVLLWRRGAGPRLWGLACRLSPLLIAGALPALFNWRAWEGRDLRFLVLVAGSGLAGEALTRVALAAPPLRRRRQAVSAGMILRRAWIPLRPFVWVSLACLVYTGFFAYHTIAFHRNLFTRSFDLGIESNAVWNIVHGGPFLKSSPFSGPDGSLIGYHAVLFAYAIAPLYALHPDPETLLALQAALAGGAGVWLFLWARRQLDEWQAALVAGCYLLYAPLHGGNLYDFHYQTLAPFFLWLTLWALDGKRDRLAAAGVAATLALREDVAASLVVLGAYFVLSGRRPRAGLVVAGVSALYFAAVKFVIMSRAQPDPSFLFAFAALLPAGGRSFEGVLATILGNPVFTLGILLTERKLVYALQVLAPLAFLPLRRPLGWLFLLPGLFFTLLSNHAPFVQISFQYTAHWTGFLFPALVLALRTLTEARGTEAAYRRPAATFALILTTLACSYQYGAILQPHTARSGFDRFRFGTTDADRARRAELRALIARIPPRAKTVGAETVVPHVCSRPDAYTLRLGLFDAEYLLFALTPTADGELERAAEALASGAFGVVDAGTVFVLAQRGHETSGNRAVLARMAPYLGHAGATPKGAAEPDASAAAPARVTRAAALAAVSQRRPAGAR